jgi:hypothetical protein
LHKVLKFDSASVPPFDFSKMWSMSGLPVTSSPHNWQMPMSRAITASRVRRHAAEQ